MRVLIIEDEAELARIIQEAFANDGIEADVERDGVAGVWRARETPYDAIVLDIMLPGQSGYVVCRELRDANVATPILMLTAKDGELDEAEALEVGADDFLNKPFSFVVLIARLRALARRQTEDHLELLTCGDLVVDPRSRTARRGGAPIDLTHREFAVLETLMLARGGVVPRTDVLERVWGDETDPVSNVVDVYIRYLRTKIDEPFQVPLIHTVRGLGYRVSEAGAS